MTPGHEVLALAETLEDDLLIFMPDTRSGILNLDTYRAAIVFVARTYDHPALARELQRIVAQIKQDLPQTRAVGIHLRREVAVFESEGQTFLDGMTTLTTAQLQNSYGLDATTAASLAPMIANSFAAHYAGDEKLTDATTIATLNAMLTSSNATLKTLGQSLYSLWTDTGPADNTVTIKPSN